MEAIENTFPCRTQHQNVLQSRVGRAPRTCVAPPFMELGSIIKAEREKRKWSQGTLAEKAGGRTNQQTVARIEEGGNSKYLAGVLRALGLDMDGNPSPVVFMPGNHDVGHYRPPPPLLIGGTIPLYASAEGGKGHLIVSTDEIGRCPRYDILDGAEHAYAILITGTSMAPAYEAGDRALVNPHLGPMHDNDCILYSEKDGEASATIKRMVNWSEREWSLRQFNPAKTFKLDRGVWQTHHRVVGNLKKQFGGRVPFGAS